MIRPVLRTHHRATLAALSLALGIAFGSAYALSAQAPEKKALTVEDYTKWRSITGQEISGDGKWAAYVLQFTNAPTADAKPVLHILNLESNADVSVANGTGPVFSTDSRWIAYTIDPGAGRGGRGGRGGGGVTAPGGNESPGGTPPPSNPSTPPVNPSGAGGQGAQGGQAGRGATTPPAPPRASSCAISRPAP